LDIDPAKQGIASHIGGMDPSGVLWLENLANGRFFAPDEERRQRQGRLKTSRFTRKTNRYSYRPGSDWARFTIWDFDSHEAESWGTCQLPLDQNNQIWDVT